MTTKGWGGTMTDQDPTFDTDEASGLITSIFDIGAVDQHQQMYKAWAAPDIYPNEPQPVLSNWHPEDLVAYCGGEYAMAAYTKEEK